MQRFPLVHIVMPKDQPRNARLLVTKTVHAIRTVYGDHLADQFADEMEPDLKNHGNDPMDIIEGISNSTCDVRWE